MNEAQDWAWNETGGVGHLMVGGHRLEVWTTGPRPGNAPSLVLLHEGLGCVALWRDFPARLAMETGLGVCVYSRAGYGASDPCELPRPLDYMTHEARTALPELLDRIGFRDGVLVGHSDGASIAAIHAGEVRDRRVRGLVLMAPHFFTEEMGLSAIAEARQAFEETDLRERLARYHRDVDAAFRGWNDAWLDPGFRDWDIRASLKRIEIPILCLQGTEDQYGTEAQVQVVAERAAGPVTIRMVPDCRHAPHLEATELALDEIVRFVARLEADKGMELGPDDV